MEYAIFLKAKGGGFLTKLLNNNQSDYFFLAKDPENKLENDYVAFLNLQ